MKKLIFTLLFMFSISIAPAIGTHYYYEWQKAIGIHQIEFETDKDLIIIDLDKNQIITDYTTYDIIEPPTKWAWHKKYREKFCIFLCNDQNFNKVFVKLIEYTKDFYIIKIYDNSLDYPIKCYYTKKIYRK